MFEVLFFVAIILWSAAYTIAKNKLQVVFAI